MHAMIKRRPVPWPGSSGVFWRDAGKIPDIITEKIISLIASVISLEFMTPSGYRKMVRNFWTDNNPGDMLPVVGIPGLVTLVHCLNNLCVPGL